MSNSNTFERRRSTPNNTMRLATSNSSKEIRRPNVTLRSTSTTETPPKMFVHRSVELLQEKGVVENITGRNRQTCENERRTSSPNQATMKPAQNSSEFELVVKI